MLLKSFLGALCKSIIWFKAILLSLDSIGSKGQYNERNFKQNRVSILSYSEEPLTIIKIDLSLSSTLRLLASNKKELCIELRIIEWVSYWYSSLSNQLPSSKLAGLGNIRTNCCKNFGNMIESFTFSKSFFNTHSLRSRHVLSQSYK